jgi:3-deoxy-D-manno-octulosonic-acid transferase
VWRLLYRAAWLAAFPLARLLGGAGSVLGRALGRHSSKLARSVRGRAAGAETLTAWAATARDTSRPLVWFHAASVGEGRQAEAVLRRLRAARPTWQIVYTHSSASAERLAATLPTDVVGYLPADTPGATARVLDALRPTAIVFAATDLWPELTGQAAARGVALALISATLAPTSTRRGPFARGLLGSAYAALDRVGAIDARDAERLLALGVRPGAVVVTGDTRHDAAAARAAAVDRTTPTLRALAGAGRPVLVAGSTWPSDETVLLPAVASLGASAPALVIAPHEPTEAHLAQIERALQAQMPDAGVVRLGEMEQAVRRSDGRTVSEEALHGPTDRLTDWPSWSVCLVDRVGILADLYAGAAMAFVGGGFHGAGLHSVIEPAAHGVPVLFGPRWQSSNDARLLLEAGGAVSVPDAAALAARLTEWTLNDDARAAAGRAARAVVDAGIGAADRSLQLVLELAERSG